MRLFLFFTFKTQDIWCVAHSVICALGCSWKKIQTMGLRIYFFENPGVFHFFTLTLEIPDKTRLSPWIFHRFVLDPLEIPIPKTDPWNFHIIFSWSHFGYYILFLINPRNFHMLFLWYLWKFHILNLPSPPPPPPPPLPPFVYIYPGISHCRV